MSTLPYKVSGELSVYTELFPASHATARKYKQRVTTSDGKEMLIELESI